ncbi:unnamed protein product [Nesidiocoris tenuis]|uniref:PIPK domain-containing protein n=1 Tax=Nesidiocoris tenuis TaxID=355587 RepID=A0A6H5HGB2_9HEMI|nr:unnamed protein product [Nesidiocoris tenuis]
MGRGGGENIQTSQIMGSIQLGIQHAVGGLASKPERDLLMQDFMTVETTVFAADGSSQTPAHHYSEFTFKTYAPIAFRYFRDLFGIQPDDFLISFCSASLRELSNPGASGSIFYLTADDEFIIKTVQHKEGEFLQKLLPGYYMNLNQNPRTLLPKFFGLYCYQCNHKNIRMVAMNNLLPSIIPMHQKYDLKGSTYKRKANKSERSKKSPTYKDLDFMEHHPDGIFLEADTYTALVNTIRRDCRVLESFKIMDYSLLVGVHNLDQESRETRAGGKVSFYAHARNRKNYEPSSAIEAYYTELLPNIIWLFPTLTFIGTVALLTLSKYHAHITVTVSICFSWQRYLLDLPEIKGNHRKFRTLVSSYIALKHSPSKRKSISRPMRSQDSTEVDGTGSPEGPVSPSYPSVLKDKAAGAQPASTKGAPPPVPPRGLPRKHNTGLGFPCSSTPPPTFEDAIRSDYHMDGVSSPRQRPASRHSTSVSEVRLECRSDKSTLSVESGGSTVGGRHFEGSTPTWTEGTPSFTESSSSGDMGILQFRSCTTRKMFYGVHRISSEMASARRLLEILRTFLNWPTETFTDERSIFQNKNRRFIPSLVHLNKEVGDKASVSLEPAVVPELLLIRDLHPPNVYTQCLSLPLACRHCSSSTFSVSLAHATPNLPTTKYTYSVASLEIRSAGGSTGKSFNPKFIRGGSNMNDPHVSSSLPTVCYLLRTAGYFKGSLITRFHPFLIWGPRDADGGRKLGNGGAAWERRNNGCHGVSMPGQLRTTGVSLGQRSPPSSH